MAFGRKGGIINSSNCSVSSWTDRKATAKGKAESKKETVKATGLRFEGRDGSSIEKTVIIKEAKNSFVGIRAERAWFSKKYPGAIKGKQALLAKDGKRYDRIEITTRDGKTVVIYFDITDFFGKF